ncbi:general substrate transporter [Aspergillus ambiguus]|uniref:sugar porter family MFS transporter n=1 Tax=Aspergillus ambiguus TaxID=176160 RepID=UPI003CCE1BBB
MAFQGFPIQFAITCTCLAAFLLFGYDQGVFAGIVTNPDFHETFRRPNSGYLGIIVSIYNIGCLVGCIINFFIGETIGRRKAIMLAMVLTSIGAVLQCAAFSVPQLMIGRIVTGLGASIKRFANPRRQINELQAELCKSKYRGQLVTTEVLFTGLGITVAYFFVFGLSFSRGPLSWRLPIAAQIIPALAIFIIVFGLPESPRWLVKRGRANEATEILAYVFDLAMEDEYIVAERDGMLNAVALEEETPFQWSEMLKQDGVKTNYRIGIAFLVLFMNQWAGINLIVFYAPTILEENVGLDRTIALAISGCIEFAFVVGSLVPSLGLDRFGRRKPMMLGSLGMAISMMMVSILLSFRGTSKQDQTSKASIAFLVTFMLSFGASLNAIPWCYSAEILPLRIRAQGTALAVMNNWIWVFTIVMVTPTMVERLAWKTYLIFMVMNLVFIPLIYFLFPETKGLTLEEIDYLFADTSNSVDRVETDSPPSTSVNRSENDPGKAITSEHIE